MLEKNHNLTKTFDKKTKTSNDEYIGLSTKDLLDLQPVALNRVISNIKYVPKIQVQVERIKEISFRPNRR